MSEPSSPAARAARSKSAPAQLETAPADLTPPQTDANPVSPNKTAPAKDSLTSHAAYYLEKSRARLSLQTMQLEIANIEAALEGAQPDRLVTDLKGRHLTSEQAAKVLELLRGSRDSLSNVVDRL
ncbi:uncharacterized protein M421DRAFT_419072 [Didymella exigua CBS 183.55]|uniref:Uncharacterized protein n=1 Tax=Didymella exigua CBS 183.55 TaxID=1150837 RepID=A0A6A5RNQ4_9PLEO|nr:uncharacterized protein M421DRAFT_419072 [Didymella exigua CBS 183.55]KAF1930041.1 hypothetical protein M421DRAFT_419072 [Didymella exigua CBS 183.55]